MCSTRRIRHSTTAKIIETNTNIVRLKTVDGDTPQYGFSLHRNNANPSVTAGSRIVDSNNKYTVLLCDARWTEIRSKALNAVIDTSWDDHFNMTRMKFTG